MKENIAIILTILGLFMAQSAPAQGTLYVSNLGQTQTGSASIGSDSWLAQSFITGTNSAGYYLNSAQLLMGPASGSAGGFVVSLYSPLGNDPGSSLGSLGGSDPTAGGLFAYTTSGIMLSPSALYYVVVTAATPTAIGAYNWGATFGPSSRSGDGWIIPGNYSGSSDGSSWQSSRQYTFQMAIYATPVPEPSTFALLLVGFGVLAWRRR